MYPHNHQTSLRTPHPTCPCTHAHKHLSISVRLHTQPSSWSSTATDRERERVSRQTHRSNIFWLGSTRNRNRPHLKEQHTPHVFTEKCTNPQRLRCAKDKEPKRLPNTFGLHTVSSWGCNAFSLSLDLRLCGLCLQGSASP